jgi:pimeloyl-ACP methyl ester carboxylesterase
MTQETIQKLTKVNGKKLYTEFYKNKENCLTLVFLHDSLGCVQLWRDFPEKLAKATKCNVLVYDRLGYGRSEPMATDERPRNYLEMEADVLNALLSTLKINEAILFGHSDGGSIALIAASKYPEKIKGIICEAAHIFVEEVTLKGIHEAIKLYKTTNLPDRLTRYHGDQVDTIFRAWTKTWMRNDYRDWNIEHFLPAIICPMLFIQGEVDEYGTLAQVERTVSQVNGKAKKFIIPNIGHTPHKEVPEIVLGASAEFINTLS